MTSLLSWLRREIPGQARDDSGAVPAQPNAGGGRGGAVPAQPNSVIPGSDPGSRSPRGTELTRTANQALVFQAAALVLTYPEADLLTRLDTIEAALDGSAAERFAPILAHLRGMRLSQLQSFHIQEFDLSRRHALHLSYWTDGDTRRRGEVLAEIKGVYRESGLLVDTGGELPDYLPMVLEFAVADPERGVALLQRFRASVELLRLGLTKDGLPHAGVLAAVCDCLPGDSPQTHAEVQARYGEARPVEFVGLDSVESLLQRPAPGNSHPASPAGHPAPSGVPAAGVLPAIRPPSVIPAEAGISSRHPGGS